MFFFLVVIIASGPTLYFIFRGLNEPNGPTQDDTDEFTEELINQRIETLLSSMSIEEKIAQLHGLGLGEWQMSFDTADNPRLNISGFRMNDGPHGVRSYPPYGPASSFPVGIAMTATWDVELLERIGTAMGEEFRGFGINQALGPCIDLQRDPRNGRSAESAGEDPYLAGWVGTALTKGIQSTGTIATVKHFAATNHQTSRMENNYIIDERSLMEFYGLPFRFTVQKGGVWSVMSAYNYINGESSSSNYNLLTEVLRDTWGYKYYVTSDWWAIYHGAAAALNAGVDVDMPGNIFGNELLNLVQSGEISEETIDRAVRRVLRAKIVSGMIDRTEEEYNSYFSTIGSLDHNQLALEAAQKSIILLKNKDNILPLNSAQLNSIALIGPSADVAQLDGFGSSYVEPIYSMTPMEGIESRFPNITINYAKGCDINSDRVTGFEEAINAANISDVVIYVGGLDQTQEGEGYSGHGDRTSGSVALPGQQQNLINQLAEVNPNLIVVLESGGICSIEESINNIKGFLYAFYPGHEGGRAIADVLFGLVNPSGKLPVTMPKNDTQLPVWSDFNFTGDIIDGFGYRRFDELNLTPRYPFGYGLSYTNFSYSNLQIDTSQFNEKHEITVKVDIKNIGTMAGDEIAQLYLSAENVSVAMPQKQLKGFKRISLEPDEIKTVNFSLGADELSYWSTEFDSYLIEKGDYTVRVGGSSHNLPMMGNFFLNQSLLYNSAENSLNSTQILSSSISMTQMPKSENSLSKEFNGINKTDYVNQIGIIGLSGLWGLIVIIIYPESSKSKLYYTH